MSESRNEDFKDIIDIQEPQRDASMSDNTEENNDNLGTNLMYTYNTLSYTSYTFVHCHTLMSGSFSRIIYTAMFYIDGR